MACSEFPANKKWALLWALPPLVLGGFIYILWRPETIRIFRWLDRVGLASTVDALKKHSSSLYESIPEWVVFSLPNGLWVLAYAYIITLLWSGSSSPLRFVFLGTIPLLGLGHELLQYAGTIRGVFCPQDLLFCSAGAVLGITTGVIAGKRGMKK